MFLVIPLALTIIFSTGFTTAFAVTPDEATITKEALADRIKMGPDSSRYDPLTGVYINVRTGSITNSDYPSKFTTLISSDGRTLYKRKGYTAFDPIKYRDLYKPLEYTVTVNKVTKSSKGWSFYLGIKGAGGILEYGSVTGAFVVSYNKTTEKFSLGVLGSGGVGSVLGDKFSAKVAIGFVTANSNALSGVSAGGSLNFLPVTGSLSIDPDGNRTYEFDFGPGTDLGVTGGVSITKSITGTLP
jgi:hypothetical protein